MNIDLLLSNFSLLNTPEKAQKLKQAILQLAVQGKLVAQDPTDEPASELRKRIKAEKVKLIKEGKLNKDKSLTPITKDEIPYELPKGWEWVRFGEPTNIILGQSPPSSTYNKDAKGLPFYQGKADFGVLYPTPSTWCTSPNKIAISGDILISVRAPVGPTNLCSENSCIGRGLSAIRMILDNSNFYFLYFLKSIEDRLSGKGFGTTFNAITGKDLNNILTPLPPAFEQHRIVEKVDQLFSRADEIESKLKKADEEIVHLNKSVLNQLLESKDEEDFTKSFEFIFGNFDLLYSDERNLKELRQSILQLAVQGKLVPHDPNDEPASELIKRIRAEKEKLIKEGKLKKEKPLPLISEDEIPYELPQGWQWVRLGEISKDVDYGTSHKSSAITQGVPILGMGNVREGNIQYDSYKYVPSQIKDLPRLFLKKNDILFNRTNSYDLVGKTGIYKKEDNSFTFASYLIRVSFLHNLTNPEYINIFFNTSLCRKTQIEPEITKQTNQANFNGTKLKNLLVPLPPFTEQKRIVEKVDQLLKSCDVLESKIVKSKEESERLVDTILQSTV